MTHPTKEWIYFYIVPMALIAIAVGASILIWSKHV